MMLASQPSVRIGGRKLREYLTGYIMIAPATILVFLFGIFPVGFAIYVSLFKWRLKQGDYIGLANYQGAIGSLVYLLIFALSLGALYAAYAAVRSIYRLAVESGERPWLLAFPGLLFAAAVLSFVRWTVLLLPQILGIADKIIGKEKTRQLFIDLLTQAFRAESVYPAFWIFIWITLAALFLALLGRGLWRTPRNLTYQIQFGLAWLAAFIGAFLAWYTYTQVSLAYQNASAGGSDPGIWPQAITISSGVLLLWLAWKVWKSIPNLDSDRSFWLRLISAVILMVGGWLLIGEIPVILASGDSAVWEGLKVTLFYSLGTIPFQLSISIVMAVLLFQRLKGSEFFRMLFFLPYVTPAVASAAVFRQLFSIRLQAPVNAIMRLLGFAPLKWLSEPNGIFTLIGNRWGFQVPSWAAGPSLALVVICMYSIWTFVGYNTVIYLAGLGNIPTELVEAAEIDGAGRWQVFRHITLPLLSPTTYFLSLIAIIGTFKAFNHIWVMRQDLALGTTDTFSVVIFNEFFDKLRFGYASALALVLFAVIISLTYINNKVQGSKVFYG